MKAPLFAGCLLLCVSLTARADVAPPNLSGCAGKAAGDACTDDEGATGTCAVGTCTRNDYSNGPPPKRVSYECLLCDAKAATAKPTATQPGAPEATPAPAPKKSDGCAATSGLSLLALGAWLLRRRRAA